MKIGDIEIEAVFDGSSSYPPADLYALARSTGKGSSASDWEAHPEFLTDEGLYPVVFGGFLVRTGTRLLLIDAGVGPPADGPLSGGLLLDSLAALGVRPTDITDVVFTHLHYDHIGWASRDGEVVFPNATYRCDIRDWEHFMANDERANRILTPVQERVDLFDGDTNLAPGVDARLATGHTPGSAIVVLSSGPSRAMLLGDVVHCAVELVDDEWSGLGDIDPALAKRTRSALARELEGTDIPIAASHFPGLKFGRLLAGEGQRGWLFG